MKYLITGAKGQLAQSFAKKLKSLKQSFIAPNEKSLDITNCNQVNKLFDKYKPKIVLNCGAYNNVNQAEEDWEAAYMVNGVAIRNLITASGRHNSILVHYSTDYVFDGKSKSDYTILDKPSPITKYGESKLLGEQYLFQSNYHKYYLIRTSWVFGSGDFSFITKLLSWMENNTELKIVDDQTSSPTHTEDLAMATLDLLKTDQFGLYHITNSGHCSRYDWAQHVAKQSAWKGKITPAKRKDFPGASSSVERSVLDNFPLKQTIGHLLPDWKEATTRYLKSRKKSK